MSDYAYTYPSHPPTDLAPHLTDGQRDLLAAVWRVHDGRDLRDVLVQADATAVDKAAVAEVLGGPGAGEEFRP